MTGDVTPQPCLQQLVTLAQSNSTKILGSYLYFLALIWVASVLINSTLPGRKIETTIHSCCPSMSVFSDNVWLVPYCAYWNVQHRDKSLNTIWMRLWCVWLYVSCVDLRHCHDTYAVERCCNFVAYLPHFWADMKKEMKIRCWWHKVHQLLVGQTVLQRWYRPLRPDLQDISSY